MKNYGMTTVGKHTVVCVVLNASSIDVEYLRGRFPDLLIDEYVRWDNDQRKVRVEGCVMNKEDFHVHYYYAKARATKHLNMERYERALRDVQFSEELVKANGIRGIIDGVKGIFKLSK